MTDQPSGAHQVWDELAAGHALHALDSGDEQRFLLHVADCPRCAATLDDYNLVAAQLGALADTEDEDEDEQTPSWQRIRAGIVADEASPVINLRRRHYWPRLLTAAAVVVALAAGAIAGWEATRPGVRPAVAALIACRHHAGCRIIRLHAPDGAQPAAVVVTGDRVAVVPLAMASAPGGRAYVLWQVRRDGGPVPVSEFRGTTRQTRLAPLPSRYADSTGFALSIEPAGPPPSRPSHVIAVGKVA